MGIPVMPFDFPTIETAHGNGGRNYRIILPANFPALIKTSGGEYSERSLPPSSTIYQPSAREASDGRRRTLSIAPEIAHRYLKIFGRVIRIKRLTSKSNSLIKNIVLSVVLK